MDTLILTVGGQSLTLGVVASFLMDTLGLKDLVSEGPNRKLYIRGILFAVCALLNIGGSFLTGMPMGLETIVVSLLSLASAVMNYEFQNS